MNDEKLILYYYKDGLSAAERQAIAEALDKDDALAERYRVLRHDLDAWRAPQDVAEPEGLAYRLQSTVDRAARLETTEAYERREARGTPRFGSRHFAWSGALAAALAVGVGIGLWLGERPAPVPPGVVQVAPAHPPEWSPVAFQRGLESHFRSGRSDLGNLPAGSDNGQGRAMLVASLLQQNRLYARLAVQNEAPDLARVLRSFEPLLQQLGRQDLSPQEAARLQDQLEFEFTVMLTKLTRGASQQAESQNEEMSL